jgi:hypothetical protein
LKVGNVALISMIAAPPFGQQRVLTGGSFRAAQSGINPHLSKGFEEYLPPQNARYLGAAAATKWLN